MSNRLIRVLSNHIKRDGKQDNVRLIRKVKHSSKRAFFFLQRIFRFSIVCLTFWHTFMTLGRKHQMCLLFALYFTAFFFVPCFLYSFVVPGWAGSGWRRDGNRTHNYMHEQSYFTQFYDMKRRTEERTFDIYSLLFIFIISFAHNSYTRTPSIVFGRPRSFRACALPPIFAARSAQTSRGVELRDDIWPPETDQGQHFFCPFLRRTRV